MKNAFSKWVVVLSLAGLATTWGAPEVVKKEFDVQPGGTLVIHADRGSIEVKSGDVSTVQIRVERELQGASAEDQADLLKQHQLEFTAGGNEVRVKASRPGKNRVSFRDPFNKLRVRYQVLVPTKFNADVHTAGGSISIASLEGKVDAHTAGGNLDLDTIKGPVVAKTSGGNIRLKDVTGDAELNTSGGNIQVGGVDGDVVAKTSGGHVHIAKVTGRAEARTSGGNIQVNEVGAGLLAQTSGGHVAARLTAQPKGDCKLSTSGGNVELSVPEDVAINVEAGTSGGTVSSDFPGEMNKSRTKLSAKINGGGPVVALSTSGGQVRVTKK